MSVNPSSLPRAVEQLTAAWLSQAFARAGIDARVESVEQTRIIWGTATKVFVTIQCSGPDSAGLPSKLCIKGGFDEQARAFGLGAAYELEGHFFSDIAAQLDFPLPRTLCVEVEDQQSVIVFEDMTARGVTFPDPLAGLSIEQVRQALEVMATWQAATWDERAPHKPWLKVGCSAARMALEVLLEEGMFNALTRRDFLPAMPAGLQQAAEVKAAYKALWALDDRSELCMSHGDAHVGQTYLDPLNGTAFLDWQGVCLAPWASDVAYFLVGALPVELRREHERALLEGYCQALAQAGGPALAWDQAWLSYRQHCLHGYIWALTPTHLQPEAVVKALAERYLAAIEDHDPVRLISD